VTWFDHEYDYSSIANRIEVTLGGARGGVVLHVDYAGFSHPSYARSASDYMCIDSEGRPRATA
jgi:hypothetical protein